MIARFAEYIKQIPKKFSTIFNVFQVREKRQRVAISEKVARLSDPRPATRQSGGLAVTGSISVP